MLIVIVDESALRKRFIRDAVSAHGHDLFTAHPFFRFTILCFCLVILALAHAWNDFFLTVPLQYVLLWRMAFTAVDQSIFADVIIRAFFCLLPCGTHDVLYHVSKIHHHSPSPE